MRPENETKLARIKKISGILRGLCKVFLVLCVIGILMQIRFLVGSRCQTAGVAHCEYWLGFTGMVFTVSSVSGVPALEQIRNYDRVTMGFILVLGYGAIFNCGYQLHRLLGHYSRGNVFTTESAGQVRLCGIACVLLGVYDLALTLAPLLMSVVHSKQAPDGLMTVGIGLAIVAISWIMEIAAEMREEQDMVI